MTETLLIANRGEIAARIARTCKKLNIATVGIATRSDASAEHLKHCDFQYLFNESVPSAPFLDPDLLVQAAIETDSSFIHPGYGSLSESPILSAACTENNLIFIGPNKECLTLFGDKESAKIHANKCGVPVLSTEKLDDKIIEDKTVLLKRAESLTFPVLIKATAGGGGRGMRLCKNKESFYEDANSASREAKKFFGDGSLLVEPYLEHIKHIEVQIACDSDGGVHHFFERECSAQRNYQKVIEEAPATSLNSTTREKLFTYATSLFKEADKKRQYVGLATVEFLLTRDEKIFFAEVNPRLQVEHTVTEEITGLDLVEIQIALAKGSTLKDLAKTLLFPKEPLQHSIQCRIYAESSYDNTPQTGVVTSFENKRVDEAGLSTKKGSLRLESVISKGSHITHHFDSMIAKLIATSSSRDKAILLSKEALTEFKTVGVETNIPLLLQALSANDFLSADYTTQTLTSIQNTFPDRKTQEQLASIASLIKLYTNSNSNSSTWNRSSTPLAITVPKRAIRVAQNDYQVSGTINHEYNSAVFLVIDGDENITYNVSNIAQEESITFTANNMEHHFQIDSCPPLDHCAHTYWVSSSYFETPIYIDWPSLRSSSSDKARSKSQEIKSPLPGTLLSVELTSDASITKGQTLFILESMKMEHPITSPTSGRIKELFVSEGETVTSGQLLATLTQAR